MQHLFRDFIELQLARCQTMMNREALKKLENFKRNVSVCFHNKLNRSLCT